MFGLFQKKNKDEPVDNHSTAPESEVESEHAQKGLRIFFSYCYEKNDRDVAVLVERVKRFAELDEDQTVYRDGQFKGPRGGQLSDLNLKRKIADRIRKCDIILCPNTKAISNNKWINWEVELGAIAYNKPVLFVDTKLHRKQNSGLLARLKDAGLNARTCGNDSVEIQAAIDALRTNEGAPIEATAT